MAEQYNPDEHTVAEVNTYLAEADDAERERVLDAERAGQARKTVDGIQGADPEAIDSDPTQGPTTKGLAFSEAAKDATPAPSGYLGVSPEAERTGRADKGLSQRNPAVMTGGPLPDPRPGVDDTEGLAALKDA